MVTRLPAPPTLACAAPALYLCCAVKSRTFACPAPEGATSSDSDSTSSSSSSVSSSNASSRSASSGGSSGGGTISAFVPFADLANHSNDPSCEFALVADGVEVAAGDRAAGEATASPSKRAASSWCFVLRPRSTAGVIQAGTEACISYGSTLGSAQLLSSYGFVTPGNQNDRLPAAWLGEAAGCMRPQLLAR